MSSSNKPTDLVHVLEQPIQNAQEWLLNLFREGEPIQNAVSIVVDHSVTQLRKDGLNTFLDNPARLANPTQESSSRRQVCGCELSQMPKRLLIEAHQLSNYSTPGQPRQWLHNLGVFNNLIDLTLTSHQHEQDINSIPGLPSLLCLRLYGVCQASVFQIDLQGFDCLRKLVIGHMGVVTKVKIGRTVIDKIDTLELYKLPSLKEVVYTDNEHSLLKWENGGSVCAQTDRLEETIFLRRLVDVPVISHGLIIYHYSCSPEEKRYKYIAYNSTQGNHGDSVY